MRYAPGPPQAHQQPLSAAGLHGTAECTARNAIETLYRICLTAGQKGNGGMCSAFSGTTMLSPGLISTGCQSTQSLRIPTWCGQITISAIEVTHCARAEAAIVMRRTSSKCGMERLLPLT